jgi:hypothetical protein
VVQAEPSPAVPGAVVQPPTAAPGAGVAAPPGDPAGTSAPAWPLIIAGGLLFAVAVSLGGYFAARRASG